MSSDRHHAGCSSRLWTLVNVPSKERDEASNLPGCRADVAALEKLGNGVRAQPSNASRGYRRTDGGDMVTENTKSK
jgi:hypothetical protein